MGGPLGSHGPPWGTHGRALGDAYAWAPLGGLWEAHGPRGLPSVPGASIGPLGTREPHRATGSLLQQILDLGGAHGHPRWGLRTCRVKNRIKNQVLLHDREHDWMSLLWPRHTCPYNVAGSTT